MSKEFEEQIDFVAELSDWNEVFEIVANVLDNWAKDPKCDIVWRGR